MENQAVDGEGFLYPWGGPRHLQVQVGKSVYQNIINQATELCYITTLFNH